MSNDWFSGTLKESTVIPQVEAIAVYTNMNGDIVIQQRNGMADGEDSFVVVPKASAGLLMKAIKAAASKK